MPVVRCRCSQQKPMCSITRRDFLAGLGTALTAGAFEAELSEAEAAKPAPRKVAAVVTVYTHNSHADLIVGRLLDGYHLDGQAPRPNLKLVSLYIDQVAAEDKGRRLAAKHGVRLCQTIEEALTIGGSDLAVSGVLLVGEHGQYPTSETGQTMYPRRRFFEETAAVFRRTGRVAPVFSDKHLSWNWDDAKWMYDTARELKVPLMAGSSLPITWRRPSLDLKRGARLSEAVGISYHTLDAYGFHALEMVQCLCERRRGGEVGVAAAQCLEGPAVWKARDAGRFDSKLLDAAWTRREQATRSKGRLEESVPNPTAFFIEYRDGFRATILTLNPANAEWCAGWREADEPEPRSTLFWTQEARPFGHFTFLVQGIERMIHTGQPTWPAERTLLTTGMLEALLISRLRGGVRLETPHLAIRYQPTFDWHEPAPPPQPLDLSGQSNK